MKKLVFLTAVLSAAALFAADPVAPFNNYDPAMKHCDGYEMAYEWQGKHQAEIEAATTEEAILKVLESEATAAGLLAKVKTAYDTDPLAATQIAAVTQWVMNEDPFFLWFWKPSPSSGRKIWARALMTKLKAANDDYVKAFCLDQLRWCGCSCQAKCIRDFATQEKCEQIRKTAELVANGLEKQTF